MGQGERRQREDQLGVLAYLRAEPFVSPDHEQQAFCFTLGLLEPICQLKRTKGPTARLKRGQMLVGLAMLENCHTFELGRAGRCKLN